jgi:hypothetical protein
MLTATAAPLADGPSREEMLPGTGSLADDHDTYSFEMPKVRLSAMYRQEQCVLSGQVAASAPQV